MTVFLNLPQHVRISGFDCRKQDLENSWHLFFIKHTDTYSLTLNVHMHDPSMHIVAGYVQGKITYAPHI